MSAGIDRPKYLFIFKINFHFSFSKKNKITKFLTNNKYINTPEVENLVVCYAVHTPIIPGKFDMAAATKLGVPKGPLCGKLVKGETIELPNGKKV